MASGQLRDCRIQESDPRSPPRYPHLSPARHTLLHPSQHILFPRTPHLRHRVVQHRRRSLWITSVWSHRLTHTRIVCLGIMFRCTERDNIHIWPPCLRCWQRRLSPISIREHWTGKES
jgi:hypothetical protein